MITPAPVVAMIGLGYIGLPTAAVVARAGCRVIGVDVSAAVVDSINRGQVHIQEADLDELVQRVVAAGTLRATTEPEPADVFVIAVPTPTDAEHRPDTGMVLDAARAIAPVLRPGNLVILESTSPIGTTEAMRDLLAELRPDLTMPGGSSPADIADVAIAYCPERVLPGQILRELVANDRVVGGISPACTAAAADFYRRFVTGTCLTTSARAAEMTKLTENAFRDVNIAFANELSMIADRLGLDAWEVIALANHHPRVNILQPGPGVGGHCIAVDPWFLVHSAPEQSPLIRTAREVNYRKVDHVVEQVLALVGDAAGPVCCLGLAFKPNIDDFRESPAIEVVEKLAGPLAGRLWVCEPFAQTLPPRVAALGVRQVDLDAALKDAAALVLLVDHDQFRALPVSALAGKTIYDTRGAWPRELRP